VLLTPFTCWAFAIALWRVDMVSRRHEHKARSARTYGDLCGPTAVAGYTNPLFSFSWVTARVRACGVDLGQLSAVVVKWIEQSLPWHDAVVVFSLRESPKRWDVQQPGLEFPGPVAPRLTPALLGDGVDAGAHVALSELCAQKLWAVGDSPQNRPGAAV
jgi:hypothetical protein